MTSVGSPRRVAWLALSLCGLLSGHGCGGDDPGPLCDAGELRRALDDAGPGDTVRVGACEVEGSFRVPSGVTLGGEGLESSRLVAPADGIAVLVESSGEETTTVSDLRIIAPVGARGGIAAQGDGRVAVRNVGVDASTGTALGVEGVLSFVAEGVTLAGPVTAANAADGCVEDLCTPEEAGRPPEDRTCSTIEELRACTATHGLALVDVGSATLTDVRATGFALFGALLLRSTTTWHGGAVSENLTTGMMVHGGSATLDGVELARTIAGLRLVPAYGGVFAGDADVTTTGLQVVDNENFGVLQDRATVRHLDLVATANQLAALWVQSSTAFELRGAGTRLSGNTLAGVVAVDSSNVLIQGDAPDAAVVIEATAGFEWPYDDLSQPTVGDGIQLLRTTAGVDVQNVRLDDNARVGVLVDVGDGSIEDMTLDQVVASGTETQNGVIAQGDRGLIPPGEGGWDDGVVRQGATEANDLAATDALAILPSALPAAKIPTLGDAASDGLRGIMGPFD